MYVGVCVCVCLCALYVQLYVSLAPLECVCVCVCGCAPRTPEGSTMNPGSPPWLRSERSPAGGRWRRGRGRETQMEELDSKPVDFSP